MLVSSSFSLSRLSLELKMFMITCLNLLLVKKVKIGQVCDHELVT